MAERFKAVDCKSIEFLIVGSNPTFSLIKIRNMAQLVARLLWEQEVACSNHAALKKIRNVGNNGFEPLTFSV